MIVQRRGQNRERAKGMHRGKARGAARTDANVEFAVSPLDESLKARILGDERVPRLVDAALQVVEQIALLCQLSTDLLPHAVERANRARELLEALILLLNYPVLLLQHSRGLNCGGGVRRGEVTHRLFLRDREQEMRG